MTIEEMNAKPLWELAEIALEDLEKCEADPNTDINMGCWVVPENGKCLVCLAGSTLYQRFGWKDDDDKPVPAFACALDHLRQGDVDAALERLGREGGDPGYLDQELTHYKESPETFKREFRTLIQDLKEAGI